ncbi:hypothetical protein DPEC_G00320700 [Dallia pectoralis]|uniref:Uncharacterized protein n=1 Tax=Dallia pectoralis TaxID=75939 RepID=A0ACC2FA55_DALPE|nr:hypothetical protein DPEC_G00320700 [Dallia pectoralis]
MDSSLAVWSRQGHVKGGPPLHGTPLAPTWPPFPPATVGIARLQRRAKSGCLEDRGNPATTRTQQAALTASWAQ